jgi:hypothetical protein
VLYTLIDGTLQQAARTEGRDGADAIVLAVEFRADELSDRYKPDRALVR